MIKNWLQENNLNDFEIYTYDKRYRHTNPEGNPAEEFINYVCPDTQSEILEAALQLDEYDCITQIMDLEEYNKNFPLCDYEEAQWYGADKNYKIGIIYVPAELLEE